MTYKIKTDKKVEYYEIQSDKIDTCKNNINATFQTMTFKCKTEANIKKKKGLLGCFNDHPGLLPGPGGLCG